MSEATSRSQEQHLRKSVMRALSIEHVRKSRIVALKQELESLEYDLVTTNKATERELEQFAKSECKTLTHQVMTKIPRELRDMIYQHLSTRNFEHVEREHFRTTLDPVTRLYSYNHARWKASHFPDHFWNSDYVGHAFFQELVENYYRTTTFAFSDDPGVMKRFLETDEMGLNILPKDLISNVEVHLNAVSYDRGSFHGYMFGVSRTPERLQEALDGLFALKEGARICIHFQTDIKMEKEKGEQYAAALPSLFSSVQVAKLAGYKVKLVVDKKQEFGLRADIAGDWAAFLGQRKQT